MIGRTLALYFAGHFARMVLGMFLFACFIIAAITYIEYFTRGLRGEATVGLTLALVSLLRVPQISDEVLPFAVLFGSIAAFVIANRRLEVVVARAAGLSAWQFLLPACIVAILIGVASATVYNPLATRLFSLSNELGAGFSMIANQLITESDSGPIWRRQSGEGSESIIGAEDTFDDGLGLSIVTAFLFDADGKFVERIDSPTGHYDSGAWVLANSTVTSPGRVPEKVASYRVPTSMTPEQARRTFQMMETISFWDLPKLIAAAKATGIPANRYELRFHTLLARPILLLAMVLIAANVSLRFSRSRDLGRMIVTGIGIGFMLYVVMKIAWDLGSGGIVPPPIAAWLPAVVTILIGITVLLQLEDG